MAFDLSAVSWGFVGLVVIVILTAVIVMLKTLADRRRDRTSDGADPASPVERAQRRFDRSSERGMVWGLGVIVVILTAVLVIALVGGPVAEFFVLTWWVWTVLPALGAFAYLIWFVLIGRRRRLPALDRTPRTGTVVQHRSVGDNETTRITTVEYCAADGESVAAPLADEIADRSVDDLPLGSAVEVYAYQDPQYAETAVFLAEAHDDVWRDGARSPWGGDGGGASFPAPAQGSPFLGADSVYRFAEPATAEPEGEARPPRVSARAARRLVVIAWIVAALGMIFAGTFGVGTSTSDLDVGVPAAIICFFAALGAMFLDGGTATRRGTLPRWSVLRLLGISIGGIGVGELLRVGTSGAEPGFAVGVWECALALALLLIPVFWGWVRRRTGGATPLYEQKESRRLIAHVLVPALVGLAVIGFGRFVWWSSVTQTAASSGIGIGVTLDDAYDPREVVVVPYKLDGLPTYQARVAAISLEDGELLWDRKLDSDVWEGYPVAVASFDRPSEDAADDTVVVTTENGDVGFDLSWGDADCGPEAARGECGIDPGQGTLANTGEPVGEGSDLYDSSPSGVDLTEIDGMAGFTDERFDTVLDPATGEPAGDGFRVEYFDGVRIISEDRVVAELADVSSLRQVLVAPSGRVVLLMHGENGKSVVVVASKDGFQQATVGDRGLVARPAWIG